MKVIIVCEILNDYIVGIFESEIKALEGIFENIQDSIDDGDVDEWDNLNDYPVKEDFRFFEVELNKALYLHANPKMVLDSNCKEIVYGNYSELKSKHRELRLEKILKK